MVLSDRTIAVLFLLVGSLVIWETRELEYWSAAGPGPRFMPLWVAGGMLVLSGWLLITSSHAASLAKDDTSLILRYLLLVVLAVFAFERIGATPTVALFTIGVLIWIQEYQPLRAFLIGMAVAIAVYVIFVQALGTPLPRADVFPW